MINHSDSALDPNNLDSKSKGRKKGVPNYNIEILLNVLEAILPTVQFDWIKVAAAYMKASGENHLRDGADIRRFFNKVHSAVRKPNQVHFSTSVLERARQIGLKMQAKADANTDGPRDHRHAEMTYERLMMENENDDQSDNSSEDNSPLHGHTKKRKNSEGSPDKFRHMPMVDIPTNNFVGHPQMNMMMDRLERDTVVSLQE
jgi:hypothetical protein